MIVPGAGAEGAVTGLLCTLRFRWEGELPRLGHFLKARRGRTAYEIVGIRVIEPGRGTFRVCRWEPQELPEHAVVHELVWDKR
jgi:hypothetical protein